MRTIAVIGVALLLLFLLVVSLRPPAFPPPIPGPTAIPAVPKKTSPPVVRAPGARPSQGIPYEPIDIAGPLLGRKILRMCIPAYPGWAEEAGIVGAVGVRIWVDPGGRVRAVRQLIRASPYTAFNDLALAALKDWEFEPIANAKGDQWGIITFRFVLQNAPASALKRLMPSAAEPRMPVLPAY